MAYNGLGTFVRLYNWANDAAAGTKIRADRMDAETDGIASGLSTAICKDGQTVTTALIPFAAGMSATTGAFSSTLSATGQLTGGGTATNNSAAAGVIGEETKSTIASASAVALTTGVAANVTSISLTAGDWDVSGVVHLTGAASTTIGGASGGISATTATLPVYSLGGADRSDCPAFGAGTPFNGGGIDLVLSATRVSLAVTTTYYLVSSATFGVSTCSAFGTIRARRMR